MKFERKQLKLAKISYNRLCLRVQERKPEKSARSFQVGVHFYPGHSQPGTSMGFCTVEWQGRNVRYVGSGIKGVESGTRRIGSGITSHGIGISSLLRDQGSGYTVFVRSRTIICHTFRIRDQKFG